MELIAYSERVGGICKDYWYRRYNEFRKRMDFWYECRVNDVLSECRWDTNLNDFKYNLDNDELYSTKVW